MAAQGQPFLINRDQPGALGAALRREGSPDLRWAPRGLPPQEGSPLSREGSRQGPVGVMALSGHRAPQSTCSSWVPPGCHPQVPTLVTCVPAAPGAPGAWVAPMAVAEQPSECGRSR